MRIFDLLIPIPNASVDIIIFISFAFYAIGKFLELQNSAQSGQFYTDFQSDIDKMWRSSQGNQEVEYIVPNKVEYVCFIDYSSPERRMYVGFYEDLEQNYYENENLFFYPLGSSEGIDSREMKNIDLTKTTENENPLCAENINGKVNFVIKKDFGENLVTIEK